jgi:hypothetical protein
MKDVLDKMKYKRDFELVIQWNSATIANLKPLENPDYEAVNLSGGSITL